MLGTSFVNTFLVECLQFYFLCSTDVGDMFFIIFGAILAENVSFFNFQFCQTFIENTTLSLPSSNCLAGAFPLTFFKIQL